jgi:hypothetical protein
MRISIPSSSARLCKSCLKTDAHDPISADKATVVDETNPGAAIRDVISADSPKLIDRKTCTPTIGSALGRSPLAGDRRDGLGLSVARKRAPTGPGAAMSSLPTAPSSSSERRAHQPMRSALGRSPLAGDRCDSWCSTVSLIPIPIRSRWAGCTPRSSGRLSR